MYYEAHITIAMNDASNQLERMEIQGLCNEFGFRLSEYAGDFEPGLYATNRSETYNRIFGGMMALVNALAIAGHKATRYKIEHVVLDSKMMPTAS